MISLKKRLLICSFLMVIVAAVGISFNDAIVEASKNIGYYVGVFSTFIFGFILFELVRIMYTAFTFEGDEKEVEN